MPQPVLSARPAALQVTLIPTQVSEVTKYTKIATSLDVPPLYKNWQWSKEVSTDSIPGLNVITVDRFDQNYLPVPLKQGVVYTATSSIISYPDAKYIDNYYALVLQKEGWLVEEQNPYLVFHSFRLRPTVADSSCGGLTSFVGYKDDMVRMVTVAHTMLPCKPPTDGKAVTQNIVYTVFISKTVPLQYFIDYMASQPK